MSLQDNKALVQHVYAEFDQQNLDALLELYAPDFTLYSPSVPQPVRGVVALAQLARVFWNALPDLRTAIGDLLADGDRVAVRFTIRGTHEGVFMDVPPTGKPVTLTGIEIIRIAGGKIEEEWVSYDRLGVLRQLGAMPVPQQAEVAASV